MKFTNFFNFFFSFYYFVYLVWIGGHRIPVDYTISFYLLLGLALFMWIYFHDKAKTFIFSSLPTKVSHFPWGHFNQVIYKITPYDPASDANSEVKWCQVALKHHGRIQEYTTIKVHFGFYVLFTLWGRCRSSQRPLLLFNSLSLSPSGTIIFGEPGGDLWSCKVLKPIKKRVSWESRT